VRPHVTPQQSSTSRVAPGAFWCILPRRQASGGFHHAFHGRTLPRKRAYTCPLRRGVLLKTRVVRKWLRGTVVSIPPRLVLLTQGVLRVGSVAVVGRGRSNSLAWWLAFTFLHTSFRLAPRLRSRLHALHRARQHQRGGRGGRGRAVSCIVYHVCWETRTHITRTQPNTKHRTQTNRHSASTKSSNKF